MGSEILRVPMDTSFHHIRDMSCQGAVVLAFIMFCVTSNRMIRTLLKYAIYKYTKFKPDVFILAILTSLIPVIIALFLFTNGHIYITAFLIIPLITAINIVIGEKYIEKGKKEFGWKVIDIV